jgi:hypothetical protein
MAEIKISQLSSGTTLDGTEVVPIVQGGATVKVTTQDIADLGGGGGVTSVDMTTPAGLTVTGAPITGAGTLALNLQSGYSIPTTANQSNWTTAYNDSITSANLSYGGASTNLVLNQQDGGTISTGLIAGAASVGEFVFYNGSNLAYAPLNATTPLSYNNGTNTFSISQSGASTDGYLSSTDWNTFNGKQASLVSGTNIKTINSTSLLGSGNVAVQPTLVSGTNIKTINGSSVLGSGDLTISGGGTNPTSTYLPINNAGVFADSPIKQTIYGPGINVLQTDNLFGFEVYDAQGYQMASLYGSGGTSTIGVGSISSEIGVSLFDASIRITSALINSGQSPVTPGARAGWLKFADEFGTSYYLPYYI